MASSTQALIRTQATSVMGAQYLDTPHSVFMPTAPNMAKQFVRENISHTSRSSDFQPGSQCRFEVERDVDVVTQLYFRFTASGIPVANWNGGATFARWCDFLGLSAWTDITIMSGTQRLQSLNPLENFIAIQKLLPNEQRRNLSALLGAGTPAQRSAASLADQEIHIPFHTLLGLNIHGDPSQGLYVRGLNDLLTIKISLAPIDTLVETDGTIPTIPTAGWFQNGRLIAEGYHLEKSERKQLAQIYKNKPHSITFNDVQYASERLYPVLQPLPSTDSFTVSNITQPLSAMFFVFRWQSDLARTVGGAGGSRGRNLWNVSGWFNPGGGATNEIVDTIAIRTGNNDVIATIPMRRLIMYQHERDFIGDIGAAIGGVSFSHDVAQPNAVLGFISFDMIQAPVCTVVFRVPTLGVAHANVGAASLADIGVTGDGTHALRLDIVGFTKTEIDQANFLLSRPFN